MPIDKYRQANRDNWDERVGVHYTSDSYAVRRFIENPDDISDVVAFDRHELGDPSGKTLLHLQCHFGRDTLSWARLGAEVTGVDFSEKAIRAAQTLSSESRTPGRFIQSELYDSPSVLEETFDIVYTSVGVLCWLPDIDTWAKVVAGFLKPDGVFYVRDGHPVFQSIDMDRIDEQLIIRHPYFQAAGPQRFDEEFSYAGDGSLKNTTNYEWAHGLGEIVNALINAGLRIEYLKEHTFLDWHGMPCMTKEDDGRYYMPEPLRHLIPLQFAIRAVPGRPS